MSRNGVAVSRLETKPTLQAGQAAVHSLRRALAGVTASVGADMGQPQDISRRFGLDKTLAWRISRAVREEDAWQALEHLPSRSGISIFAAAMTKAGAKADKLNTLWLALDEFEHFVESHAGDRATLNIIVSGPNDRSAHKKLEAFRKAGFQCNSSLLGARASLQFAAQILAPSKTAGMVDLGVLTGMTELLRLRPTSPWPIATVRNWGGMPGGLIDKAQGVLPIEVAADGTPSPLMREFCSPTALDICVIEQPPGTYRYLLKGGDLGFGGAANVVSGWMYIGTAPLRQTSPTELGEHGLILTTPAEELVFDVLIHRELDFAMDVTAAVYSQFPGRPLYPSPDADPVHSMLPVPTKVLDLGMTIPDSPSAKLPQYADILARVAARMGVELSDFRSFRYRLKYPPIPSMCVLSHPLLPMN